VDWCRLECLGVGWDGIKYVVTDWNACHTTIFKSSNYLILYLNSSVSVLTLSEL
jgi:hypothetical protein